MNKSLVNNTDLFKQICHDLPTLSVAKNVDLSKLTYFRLGGLAEVYVEVSQESEVIDLVRWSNEHGVRLTVLGGGSNVLVSSHGVSGIVLKMKNSSFSFTVDSNYYLVNAQSGIRMADLVMKSINVGAAGLENFFGVPGTLGGAIYNNAHYQGDLIGDYVEKVMTVSRDGVEYYYSQGECEFAYEHSVFQENKDIILSVEFRLPKGDKALSMAKLKKAALYRAQTQPIGELNSGCFFQNVKNNERLRSLFPQFAQKSEVPAGFLIDQAGLKGLKYGDIMVSHKHAAFLINLGSGTSDEVSELARQIREQVLAKFGVELKSEVFLLE